MSFVSYLAHQPVKRALGDVAALAFPTSVLQWKPLLYRYASIPGVDQVQLVNFLLGWIKIESGGNPCSYTSLRESGIIQLMPPDNTNVAGTTEAALRVACVPGTQMLARSLTSAEAQLQIVSGMRYVQYVFDQARKKLAAAGASWPTSSRDFWSMVKLGHAYPAPIAGWLAQATAKYGRPPRSWAEFRSAISGYQSVLDNAERTGAYATGGGGSLLVPLLLAGGAALLYRLATRH